MTPEEAIKTITQMLDEFCNEDSYAPECKDAVDMAIEALKEQDVPDTNVGDTISRQAAIDAAIKATDDWDGGYNITRANMIEKELNDLPSAQPESTRTFVELVVRYPDPELCAYKEYKGKPYYSIKYIENGETHVGYGTYNPEVLSQYLKEYFISSAQPGPEIHWGYTPTYERPLADREIVPRLRDIQKQVGGSYAIDRAIEIIEAVAERRTDDADVDA